MINYEALESPYYETNKNYCHNIENQLKNLGSECTGFCNTYGYEINAEFKRNDASYKIKLNKNQSTQNGVVIPVNAIEYRGVVFSITNLNKKFSVSIGQSGIKRFFTNNQLNNALPKPYYASINYPIDSTVLDKLVKQILDNNIAKLELSNGQLMFKMHHEIANLDSFIKDIEELVNCWK